MNITQLTVVNACLASMGEEPLNSLAEDNAFVNSAKFALEQATINEQSRGWYFNLEVLTLSPDTRDNMYRVPADVLDFSKDEFNPSWWSLRGQRIYDNAKADFLTGTQPVQIKIIRLVVFEDLPIMARRMTKAAAVLIFQQSYDGDELKIREAQLEYEQAYALLNSQHIRAVNANFLARRGATYRHSRRLPT